MNIDTNLMASVLAHVHLRADHFDDELVTHLRGTFPGVHFSICKDDDMPPRLPAVAENGRCRLYYVDSSDNCLRLTSEAAAATGLVVALLDPDEWI